MNQQEIRLLRNLQQLGNKGNCVRLRYVPSHLLDEDQWNDFRCRDTIGNRFADSKFTDLMKGRLTNLTMFHFPGQWLLFPEVTIPNLISASTTKHARWLGDGSMNNSILFQIWMCQKVFVYLIKVSS
jgi:hypothetical protein